ncbi:MAG: hypothetical protein Q4P09_06145 [Phascolarctobacterium sp.]|nr:hypothetical protein [Phascolarctobacterium sp.]
MEEIKNETSIEIIKNLKETQNWSTEEALIALNIDKSRWPQLLALLEASSD